MLKLTMLAWMMLLLTSGCAISGQEKISDSWCDKDFPLLGTAHDWGVIGAPLKRQIQQHNDNGAVICGWS